MIFRPVPFLERQRERLGETFALHVRGPGRLVMLTDPPSIKKLFAADRVNTIAPGRNVILRPVLGHGSLLLQTGDEHLRRRKLMLPPFHGERMRAYEATIAEATERTVERWPTADAFPVHPSMQAITLEVVLRAVFGVEEAGRRQALRDGLVEILAATGSPLAVGLTVPGLRRLPPFSRVARMLERTDALLHEEIARHRADPEVAERDDILSMLIAARFEDGESMGDAELRDQLMTLLLAGHETTATGLAWTIDLLTHDRPRLERLQSEVRAGERAYLDAVIEESLRVRPVVPMTGRELLEPAALGGYELPAGTVAMVGIGLVHSREDVYPEAKEFRPERFLEGGTETYSWLPFGGGTRRCIGASFALLEMRVALEAILRRFDLSAAETEPERPTRRNVTLSPRGGARVVARAV